MDRQRPYGNRGNHPGGKKVRKMVALYDYDPQELSPNVDAEVRIESLNQRGPNQTPPMTC